MRTLLADRQRVASRGEVVPVRRSFRRLADGGFEGIDSVAVAIDQEVCGARLVACARRGVVELGLDDRACSAGELQAGGIE
ncbi:MAG: hypothetical protein WB973_00485, partial [Thermoanaerobaculia bacterium]